MGHPRTSVLALAAAAVVTSALGLAGCSNSKGARLVPPGPAAEQARYLPEYAANGDLLLPKNFETWVYLGSPLTPNAQNNGRANFPEFHNVYIEPGSYAIYKKTGVFPEGTILFKELQLTQPPATHPDGSREEPSGRGYFPGKLNGADVAVKDSKRYAATKGWGYYNFHHYEPKAAQASLRPAAECSSCHEAGAKKDFVWVQFYPRLQ